MKKAAKMIRRNEVVAELPEIENELFANLRAILAKARAAIYTVANAAMVEAYWNVGREIVEKQGGVRRARYGDGLLKAVSRRLMAEFGEGFTVSNLRNMRQFYLAFPKRHTLCSELSWSHYRILMRVENENARTYYMRECAEAGWSVRILERQIASLYYERLLRNKANPQSLKALIKKEPKQLKDIIRSPAILEFTGLDVEAYREKDLETALIKNIRMFLMELGRGFCLEAEQKKIRIGEEVYSCDLVFYNYIARCFFLVDLKVGKVTPQDIGQMQLYKHYYEREMMRPGDNPPVGIVLGSSTDSAVVEYTLNEHERNLFAVKYHLSLPTVEELQCELKRERMAIEEAMLLLRFDDEQKKSDAGPIRPKSDGRIRRVGGRKAGHWEVVD